MATAVERKSLPLTERDRADIAKLRQTPAMREALEALGQVALPEGVSEATLLHALLVAGIRATEERAELAGYQALAEQYDEAEHRRIARRRRPAWADDE